MVARGGVNVPWVAIIAGIFKEFEDRMVIGLFDNR